MKRYAEGERQHDIVAAMEERGWSQERTAEFLGISAQYFIKLVTFKYTPKKGFSQKLSERLFELTNKFPEELFPTPELVEELSLNDRKVRDEVYNLDCVCHVKSGGVKELVSPIEPTELSFDFELKVAVQELLKTLNNQQRTVITLRFFGGYTLEEVGEVLSVTRERIRQVEARALRLLRHPSRSRRLVDFVKFQTLSTSAKIPK